MSKEPNIPREYLGFDEGVEIKNNNNTISSIFTFLGIVIFIAGGLLGNEIGNRGLYEFNWFTASYIWVGSFITGMIFIGIGEIIQKLHEISNNTRK